MSPYRAGDNPPKVINPKWIQYKLGPSIDGSMPDYLPVVRGFFLGTQKNGPYYVLDFTHKNNGFQFWSLSLIYGIEKMDT